MLAYRRTWHIKAGHMEEAREMIQQAVDLFKEHDLIGRAYSSNIGPADTIVWEEVWSDIDEHNKFWSEFRQDSETQEWFQDWYELVERGGTQEIWSLEA